MNKYSLKTFTLLWMSIFIFSFLAFIYIILNLFFSDHITQSSLKDLKYNAYVAKLALSEEQEKMKNSLALHVTSPEFTSFLGSNNFIKTRALVDNWRRLLKLDDISLYNNFGEKLDLEQGVISDEGVILSEAVRSKLDLGYEQTTYITTNDDLVISVQRKITDSAYMPLGYLVESKKIPYEDFLKDSEGRDLIVKTGAGVVYTSKGIAAASRLSDKAFAKGAAAFELSMEGKSFDVFRLDFVAGVTFFLVKENLKTKVFEKFYRKYLMYFVVFLFFLLMLFYLSYYRQVFKPLEQISRVIIEGGLEEEEKVETAVNEISVIANKVAARLTELSDDVEKTKKGRVDDMSRLVASVAHELNNSLSYLGGNLDYLKGELSEGSSEIDVADFKEAIDSAQSGYERIKKIVSDLRVFSSKRDLSVSWVRIEKLKDMIEKDFSDVDISFPKALSEYEVEIDLARTFQIIKNLIVNAEQAGDQKNLSKKILSSFYLEDDGFVVAIKDWSGGIPSEAQGKIFEPFYTTKKNIGGAGLGLALSRSLAHEMSASLLLKETGLDGTTFCFKMKRFRSKA